MSIYKNLENKQFNEKFKIKLNDHFYIYIHYPTQRQQKFKFNEVHYLTEYPQKRLHYLEIIKKYVPIFNLFSFFNHL